MKNLILLFVLFIPGSAFAQNSTHGLSFRAGIRTMSDFDILQPDPEVVEVVVYGESAYGASLRYHHYFGERWSAYAGLGYTSTSANIDFSVPDDAEVSPGFGGGDLLDQAISQIEFGASYALPLLRRLSLVAEIGGQVASIQRGGSQSGQQGRFSNGEPLYVSNYSYELNGNTGLALQLSPGIRYQITDHFYLTVRGDFVFSSVKMVDNGFVDGWNVGMAEPAVGSFDRSYASKGLDLMVTCRF